MIVLFVFVQFPSHAGSDDVTLESTAIYTVISSPAVNVPKSVVTSFESQAVLIASAPARLEGIDTAVISLSPKRVEPTLKSL